MEAARGRGSALRLWAAAQRRERREEGGPGGPLYGDGRTVGGL
ncbi:hypothetical protein STRAU_1028 [Streptomyces aurantiacus JA 4570]|uniref:Uncharacterized protein n=1 Tax=Streptomyces aurantiacus JA 4570 TaxID=1286094 RepID=S4AWS8_9ACTN|nr:hypothetical protein STRAU_1028 [Streptomyces aurantiacus JA 4570]